MKVQAYAAHEASGKLESFEYELGLLKPDEVEIDVEYCGICHSDLSMLKNEWGHFHALMMQWHILNQAKHVIE